MSAMAESDILPVESLGEEEDILKCKHCDNTFTKHKALKKHMKKSHFRVDDADAAEDVDVDEIELQKEKNKTMYECNYCDRTFKRERNLALHIRDDHGGEDKIEDNESIEHGECNSPVTNINAVTQEEQLDKEISPGEDLLAEEGDAPVEEAQVEMTGTLDEVVIDASDMDMEGIEFELDGTSLPMEAIDFDIDQTTDETEEGQKELPSSQVMEEQATDDDAQELMDENSSAIDLGKASDVEAAEATELSDATTVTETETVDEELPENVLENGEESLDFDGDSIVMDDDAFNLLESAMQMTMSTPDDSDEEDVPLSSRKKKVEPKRKVSRKRGRGRHSKNSNDDVEILLDGEAVVEDPDSSADDDIVVVDEVNIVQKEDGAEESASEESEAEDDDPDFVFAPSKRKRSRKEISQSLRKSSRKKKKTQTNSSKSSSAVVVEEQVFKRGRTKISVVPDKDSVPALKTIPKSTRIVFNSGNAQAGAEKVVNIGHSSLTIKTADNEPVKKLLCSICKKVFITRDQFNIHMIKDHKKQAVSNPPLIKQQKKFQCLKCPKYFDKKMSLDEHTKVAHTFKCTKCRQKFDTQEALSNHMRTHFVKCDKCSFKAETKLKVLEHKKEAHNFRCSKCRQAFDQKDKLEAHIKANHFFRCGKCNVTFDAKTLIEEHNKKNHYFPCGSCNKVFDMRQRLATHDKAAHQSCDVCEDEFSWPEPGHACYYTKNNIRPVIKS